MILVTFNIFVAVTMKMTVFWYMMLCSPFHNKHCTWVAGTLVLYRACLRQTGSMYQQKGPKDKCGS
jgi:hypothetical protein